MTDAATTASGLTVGYTPTLVDGRSNYYYDKARVFMGLIGNQNKFLVPDGMIAINVPIEDTLAMIAVNEGTATDSEAFTGLSLPLTPILLGAHVLSSLYAQMSSPMDLAESYARVAGTARAVLEDDNTTYGFNVIAAAAGDSSNDLGTSGTALTASLARQGVAKLMVGGGKPPYNWCIGPTQFEELMRDAEAKTWLMSTRGQNPEYIASVGVAPDRYCGQIYGAHVWVMNTVYSSSGYHSIMFAQDALGQAYKLVKTPQNPVPAEMHTSMTWVEELSAYRYFFRVCMVNSGTYYHATSTAHNTRIADIIS